LEDNFGAVTFARRKLPAIVHVQMVDPALAHVLPAAADLPRLDVQRAYREHGDFVFRSLQRLGVPTADLEDLTQEVFLVAHRRAASFDPDVRLTTWLFGIALRVAKRHRRRPWFARERPLSGTPEPEHTHTPERALEHAESQRRLALALRSLRPERCAVFVMFELEGMALRDIAARMETPIGTACSRLHAARKDLERALRRVKPALLCAVLAVMGLGVASHLKRNDAEDMPRVIAQLRPEPAPVPAAIEPKPAITSAPATHVDVGPRQAPAPTRQPRTTRSPRRHEALGRAAPSPAVASEAEPAWLIEARAVLATHPERTLALIRANRDPHVAVTPELLELTVLALEAQRVQSAARAVHEP
jgi:RNA polymerase sigma-70 factor (ECF subfamily)